MRTSIFASGFVAISVLLTTVDAAAIQSMEAIEQELDQMRSEYKENKHQRRKARRDGRAEEMESLEQDMRDARARIRELKAQKRREKKERRKLEKEGWLVIEGHVHGAACETKTPCPHGVSIIKDPRPKARREPGSLYVEGAAVINRAEGDDDVHAYGALGMGRTVSNHFGLGIGLIGLAQLEQPSGDDIWAINFAPYGELYFFLGSWIQLYGQLGVALQFRFGLDDEDPDHPTLLGPVSWAPMGALGARVWFGDHFSAGPVARVLYIGGDGYVTPTGTVAPKSVIFTGGLTASLHF